MVAVADTIERSDAVVITGDCFPVDDQAMREIIAGTAVEPHLRAALSGDDPKAIMLEPASQWTRIQTQVTAPSEGGLGGVIAEGWYAIVDGELRIEDWRGRMFARPIAPGEDAAMLARKVLREKWASHDGGFNDPIRYPPRSIH
jgi:hypothetical protein